MSEQYRAAATSESPALIVYLIDTSGSMGKPISADDPRRKIDAVNDGLERSLGTLIDMSMKGRLCSPRYLISLVSYSATPDVVGEEEVMTIADLAKRGVPHCEKVGGGTDTTSAFMKARDIIARATPRLSSASPAPLICHLTDGIYNRGGDPEAAVREIASMKFADGAPLIENIYIGSGLTRAHTGPLENWPGVRDVAELADPWAKRLYEMSSSMPEMFRSRVNEEGYSLSVGAKMFFPGDTPQVVELGFAVARTTGAGRK